MPEKMTVRIDGEYVAAHARARRFSRWRAPAASTSRRSATWRASPPVGRLPAVHGGGLRGRPPAARLHHAGAGRHVRHHQLREARALPADRARVALLRAQPQLRRVRLQRPLRAAGPGPAPGRDHVRYPYTFPRLPVDISHERYVLDHNRCILCTRCVRVCAEIEGAHVWDIGSRGIQSHARLRAEPALGHSRRAAPAAASACRPARPARWPRRASRVEEMVKHDE